MDSLLPKHRRSRWHAGERILQQKIGASERMEAVGQKVIRDYMPDQHREFYEQLPFMIVGTVDPQGRPWATMIEGTPGFVSSPDPRHLDLALTPDSDDPAAPGMGSGSAIGMLGIELHTRRRNRVNGVIVEASPGRLRLAVEHAFGNCPQYIQKRTYALRSQPARGEPVRQELSMQDQRVAAMIREADTFFVASFVEHEDGQRSVDVSHRGGRPGFVKLDGNLLTIPDYAGNLHFNTLGNLQVNPRAGLLFVNFASGDVLQLTGRTQLILESPVIAAFEGAERLWTFEAQQAVLRRGAVSLRWDFQELAPTSLMTGSWPEAQRRLDQLEQRQQWHPWRVWRRERESRDILSLYLRPLDDAPVLFSPGQHVPVRLQTEGAQPLTRTYSVSSAPSDGFIRISIKAQGPASRFLHEGVQVGDILQARPPLGSFTLKTGTGRPVVLLGAGVGITPLISMVRELANQIEQGRWNQPVYLFQSARTLDDLAFGHEIKGLMQRARDHLHVVRALSDPGDSAVAGRDYEIAGRLGFKQVRARLPLDDYDFYVCGPAAFIQDMYDGLRDVNVPDGRIHAETFGPSALRRATAALEQPAPARTPVPVYFSASSKEARWTPESGSLLELAESRGLHPESSCRAGSCGTCKVRRMSGQVHYPLPPAQLPEDDTVLICCAVPAEDSSGVNPLVLDV